MVCINRRERDFIGDSPISSVFLLMMAGCQQAAGYQKLPVANQSHASTIWFQRIFYFLSFQQYIAVFFWFILLMKISFGLVTSWSWLTDTRSFAPLTCSCHLDPHDHRLLNKLFIKTTGEYNVLVRIYILIYTYIYIYTPAVWEPEDLIRTGRGRPTPSSLPPPVH